MSNSSFESLDALAASLPFHVDDVSAVNATYSRWRSDRDPSDQHVVQLWTYCFIRRYFLVKFVQESAYSVADLDLLIDKTFRKVERSEDQVKEPRRYASWVSVVCKNTYRNYLRRRRPAVSLDEPSMPLLVAEGPVVYQDAGMARQAVLSAIDRLPPYLQTCVRLRFLEGLSYNEIADRTDQPPPSIRAYIYKALQRLREDEELIQHFQ